MGNVDKDRNPIGVDPEQAEVVTRDSEEIVVDENGEKLIITTGHSQKTRHQPDIASAKESEIVPACYNEIKREGNYVFRREKRTSDSISNCNFCTGVAEGPEKGNDHRVCEDLKDLNWDEFAERSSELSVDSDDQSLVTDGGTERDS